MLAFPVLFAVASGIIMSCIKDCEDRVAIGSVLFGFLVFISAMAVSTQAKAVVDSSIIPAVNHDYFYVGDRYENGIHYLDYFRPNYTFRITDQYVHTVLVAEGVDERGRVELLVFAPVMVDCYSSTTPHRVVEIVVYNSNGNLMGYNNLYARGINQGYAHPQVKNYVCGGW